MQQKTALSLLFLFYFLFIVIIGPFHEYPLHDDWHYADAVRHLQETSEMRLDPVVSANVVLMVLYGFAAVVLFQSVVGFFGALQLTTLLLGFLGVIVFYLFLRRLEFDVVKSFFGSLVLMFNPLYLLLSFTFMTDVPFIAFLVFSLYFFVRWLQEEKYSFLLLALLFSLFSFMIRQQGALFFAALFFFALLMKKNVYKEILVSSVLIVLFMWYRYSISASSVSYSTSFFPSLPSLFFNIIHVPFFFFMYIGFFCFPVLVPLFPQMKKFLSQKIFKIISCVLLFYVSLYFILGHRIMPYIGFALNASGLGQIFFLAGEKVPLYPHWLWVVITLLSFLCAALLVFFCLRTFATWRSLSPSFLFLGILFLVHFIFLLVIARFDRYFLPFIVLLLPFVLLHASLNKRVTLVCLALLALFSMVGVVDYFAWNDARWGTVNDLHSEGVPLEDINAGQEWAGWYFFWSHLVQDKSPEATYLLSFSVLPHTEVNREIPYSVWGLHRKLYVLERD